MRSSSACFERVEKCSSAKANTTIQYLGPYETFFCGFYMSDSYIENKFRIFNNVAQPNKTNGSFSDVFYQVKKTKFYATFCLIVSGSSIEILLTGEGSHQNEKVCWTRSSVVKRYLRDCSYSHFNFSVKELIDHNSGVFVYTKLCQFSPLTRIKTIISGSIV